MTPKTAPAKNKGKGGARKGSTKKAPPKDTRERDGGLERLYARVTPAVKATIDNAAAADGRSTMNYVEHMINQRAAQLDKKNTKGK